MDSKTSKILSSIAGGIIILGFFLPWSKSMFGAGSSAWGMIEQLANMLSYASSSPRDIGVYLPFILLLLPICSTVVILKSLANINNHDNTARGSKITSIIIVILVFIGLLIAQSKNPFSSSTSVFDHLGIGFHLTIIGNAYFLIDLLTVKRRPRTYYTPKPETYIFCSNCGERYPEFSDAQFCEECGEKL